MSTEIQIALVGVIGTLAGTFLGWILNTLSKSGKLHIYISSFEETFKYNKSGYMVSSSSIKETENYNYTLIMDLYNSSGETKIMRNLAIVFSDGKNELFESIPKDDSTARRNGPLWFYDEITPINIPPKTIAQLKLHNGAWHKDGGLDFIWKTRKVYLAYTNEKNKRRKIKIKSKVYSDHFKNRKTEDKGNG